MSALDRQGDVDRVAKAWAGKTVVCIAAGPSVTAEQLRIVEQARQADEVRAIAINDMYLVAPWADICYFADLRWFKWHTGGLAKSWPWVQFTDAEVRDAFARFPGQKVTIRQYGNTPGGKEKRATEYGPSVFILRNYGCDGMSERPDGLHTGKNSGYQALQIAAHAGARRVLLLGYDMRFVGGRSHSHDGHRERTGESSYGEYARKFHTIEQPLRQMGVEVLNCTPGSLIGSFKHAKLAEVLGRQAAA